MTQPDYQTPARPRAGETRAEREYFYLVRADRFVADSSGNPDPGERELMGELTWWPVSDPDRVLDGRSRDNGGVIDDE